MHGEFKQTYVTTIEVVLSMIKELAGLMDKIPAAKVVPAFEESRMFPKEYPKELPKLTQPGPHHPSQMRRNPSSHHLFPHQPVFVFDFF
jgi:hypothetical protein